MKDAAEDDYEYDYENSYVFDDDKEINQTNSDYSLLVLFCFAEGKDIEDCLKTSTMGPDSEEGPEYIAIKAITGMDATTKIVIPSMREQKSSTKKDEEFVTKKSIRSGATNMHETQEDNFSPKSSVKRTVVLRSSPAIETVNGQIKLSFNFTMIFMTIVLSDKLNIL